MIIQLKIILFVVSLLMPIFLIYELNNTSYGDEANVLIIIKGSHHKSQFVWSGVDLVSSLNKSKSKILVRCRLGSSMAGAANAYVQQRVLQVENWFFNKILIVFFFNKILNLFFNKILNFFKTKSSSTPWPLCSQKSWNILKNKILNKEIFVKQNIE